MPTSPTHKPAGDDGRRDGHPETVTDRIRNKLRTMPAVDGQGRPVQPQQNGDDE